MSQFTFRTENPGSQYVQIEARFKASSDQLKIHLPAWRPGRYELGNFAKFVRNFRVSNGEGKALDFSKTSKDAWQVDTKGSSEVVVNYNFYAATINAGSTFFDANQLYVNPVNCCVYTEEQFNDRVEVNLEIPADWQVATAMTQEDDVWFVDSFDKLFDSPFIASNSLQVQSYESFGTMFHVWFNGVVKPDWDRVMKDFQAFTDAQIAKFTEFPVKEYHYINLILPYKAYHGVEHQKSTVIALGPSYEIFGDLYKELLGVSSHELYHTWNVKAIRPIEMYPYDFSKENYSRLGYICEGVTTYQGDLFLAKSKVFNDQQYFDELNIQLQRHFDNAGRFHYSLGDSSFDTWLDGYELGAPGRKVSIYTEGCLLAFVADTMILRATNEKYGLDEVMKRLYFNYSLEGKGVSEDDYKSMLENVSGISFDEYFDNYINGTSPYESIIVEALEYLGLDLDHVPSKEYCEGRLGMKVTASGKNFKIHAMYPGGPAETGGLMLGDEIICINNIACNGELNKWLQYFDDEIKKINVIREGQIVSCQMPEVNRNFYMKYSVKKQKNPNGLQQKAFKAWLS